MISTPIGPIPYSLEDLSPWCHLTGPDGMWEPISDEHEISDALDELGLSGLPLTRIAPEDEFDEMSDSEDISGWLDRCSIVDKLSLLCSIHPLDACKMTDEMACRRSRTDRVVNVSSGGHTHLVPQTDRWGNLTYRRGGLDSQRSE